MIVVYNKETGKIIYTVESSRMDFLNGKLMDEQEILYSTDKKVRSSTHKVNLDKKK